MRMAVSEFKAKCTQVLRDIAAQGTVVEVTNRGRVIAVVVPPRPDELPDPRQFFGSLRGTVLYLSADFDEPLGDGEWEAAR